MKKSELINTIKEYLNEQDVKFNENEEVSLLCFRAALEGYSFSDGMYKGKTRKYLPTEREFILINTILKLRETTLEKTSGKVEFKMDDYKIIGSSRVE